MFGRCTCATRFGSSRVLCISLHTQLRTLLALKLQEDFADFLALKKETNDIVVQQHYRTVLEHVFEVLQQLQIPLKTE